MKRKTEDIMTRNWPFSLDCSIWLLQNGKNIEESIAKYFYVSLLIQKAIIKTIYIYTYLTEIYVKRQGEGERERGEKA